MTTSRRAAENELRSWSSAALLSVRRAFKIDNRRTHPAELIPRTHPGGDINPPHAHRRPAGYPLQAVRVLMIITVKVGAMGRPPDIAIPHIHFIYRRR